MAKLAQALARHASSAGEQIAMSDGRRSLTRSELADWVAAVAHDLGPAHETVGIFGNNSVEWAVAFLAASVAGKTIVPIPVFFSEGQRGHLIRDARIARVMLTDSPSAESLPPSVPSYRLRELPGRGLPPQARDGGLIIYTSGSTGNPKGVRLMSGQALWSAETLAKAIGARAEDKYLSVLPLPLLLELICGIIIPTLVGGSVHYDSGIAQSVGVGALCNIAEAFERARPTTSVLVPQLLALYAGQLAAANGVLLRSCALSPSAALLFLQPLREPRGTSEFLFSRDMDFRNAVSVVAVNRPGALREGTAGQPLPGLRRRNRGRGNHRRRTVRHGRLPARRGSAAPLADGRHRQPRCRRLSHRLRPPGQFDRHALWPEPEPRMDRNHAARRSEDRRLRACVKLEVLLG